MNDKEKLAGALVCLESVVELLIEEGIAKAGEYEGLLAYQALSRIKSQAEIFDVPLSEIGLANFNPDILLQKQRLAA